MKAPQPLEINPFIRFSTHSLYLTPKTLSLEINKSQQDGH
jgi:hypothetical protein